MIDEGFIVSPNWAVLRQKHFIFPENIVNVPNLFMAKLREVIQSVREAKQNNEFDGQFKADCEFSCFRSHSEWFQWTEFHSLSETRSTLPQGAMLNKGLQSRCTINIIINHAQFLKTINKPYFYISSIIFFKNPF